MAADRLEVIFNGRSTQRLDPFYAIEPQTIFAGGPASTVSEMVKRVATDSESIVIRGSTTENIGFLLAG
jgi:hypothetical protein